MSAEIPVSQEKPFVREMKWPNGFTLLLHQASHARTITARLCVKAGPRFEKLSRVGSHHYIEHLLPSATQKHPNYLSLFTFLAHKGMEPDFETDFDQSAYSVKGKRGQTSEMVPYLFDLIKKPPFYKRDRVREERRVNEEILEYVDDPDEHIDDIFAREAWKFFPIGAGGILGKKETLSAVKRRSILEEEFKKVYRPDNMILFVVGDFNENEIVSQAGESFGKLVNEGPYRLDSYPTPVYMPNGKHVSIKYRDLEQVQVLLGFPIGKELLGKYSYEIDLLSTMLWKSVEFKLIEKYGKAYHLKSEPWLYSDFGALKFKVAVRKRNVSFAVDTIVKEIREQKFEENEILLMKDLQKTLYASDQEDTDSLARQIEEKYRLTGQAPSPEEMERKIDLVRPEILEYLHAEICKHDNAILAMLGRVSKDEAPRYEQKLQFGR